MIPETLTKPVLVTCQTGDSQLYLGRCAIALRQGLNQANSQLTTIARITNTGPR